MLSPRSQPIPEPQSQDFGALSKPQLSPREIQIARIVALGHSHAAIATELGLQIQTGKASLSIIYGKLAIKSRTPSGSSQKGCDLRIIRATLARK